MGLIKATIISAESCDVVEVETSKLLLHAVAQRLKSPIKVGCKGGGCGVCKVKIVAGEYATKVMSKAHVSDAEAQQGYALACRVLPITDLTIEVLNQ